MDILDNARNLMDLSNDAIREDGSKIHTTVAIAMAQAYAAIAQAEQLKRIADQLEDICGRGDGEGYLRTHEIEW